MRSRMVPPTLDPRSLTSSFESSGSGVGLAAPPVHELVRDDPKTSHGDRPPFNWDDWDWGDDGDGGGGGSNPGGNDDGRGVFAMGLLIFSICTLFGVFLVAFLVLRSSPATWPPEQHVAPPWELWVSTVLIGLSSLTMSRAVIAAREDRSRRLRRWMGVTLLLGLAFLGAQAQVWEALRAQDLLPSTNTYGTIFYAVTGLHALHIVAGLGYLGVLSLRVRAKESRERATDSVPACALYWHTMGCIWAVLFAVLTTSP